MLFSGFFVCHGRCARSTQVVLGFFNLDVPKCVDIGSGQMVLGFFVCTEACGCAGMGSKQ